MAPQAEIPIAATVLGTIGTALHVSRLWCIQLIPQIIANWRTKNTTGLPASMMVLWALCCCPFGAYAIIQKFNIPIQVQPQALLALSIISLVQILMYSHNYSTFKALAVGAALGVVLGGVEVGLIFGIRPIYDGGDERPVLAIGIVASILLAAGLLPPYGEIWKRRGRVIGINWIFLATDWFGAFFSLMALVAQQTFDVTGGVLYILCALLELFIFVSHGVWLLRTRKVRRDAAARGLTFDELEAEHTASGTPFRFAERDGTLLGAVWTAVWRRRRAAAAGPDATAAADGEVEKGHPAAAAAAAQLELGAGKGKTASLATPPDDDDDTVTAATTDGGDDEKKRDSGVVVVASTAAAAANSARGEGGGARGEE